MAIAIHEVPLSSGSKAMPRIAMGTAVFPLPPFDTTRDAMLHAIKIGYRHFDTASVYSSEEPLGEAVAEALRLGFIASRDELFITSKLWVRDAQSHLVLPALQKSLRSLQLEYLDLYLIHYPICAKPGGLPSAIENFTSMSKDELMPIDVSSVWAAMEECQTMGLTKSIGVSNFSIKKIEKLLSTATIPPVANQVEVNPLCQQKKLREFCMAKGIQLCAYSPLGARGTAWGQNWVMECEILQQIAKAKGKTLPQICLRWVYEQGDCVIVKSYSEKRLMENLDILDWELNEEERETISRIPQRRGNQALFFISENGPYKSLEEFWDDEI
ncbi:deoxymugineic acid synthase 1-B-like isoform X2 [Curcuma longa]|uniref:deoxymugineic acid synthase 1-B-like isoform X2 n=1 Tax=Curcuma longa TaxID=136217 RepID=UPI003D9E7415